MRAVDEGQPWLPFLRPQKVTGTFDEGEIASNAGALLLRQLDDQVGLTAALAETLQDWRNPIFVVHNFHEMVRVRVFGIAQGYEDCNDAAMLRQDVLFKAICRGPDDVALASQPSLSRFENRAIRGGLERARFVLLERFIARYKRRFTRSKRASACAVDRTARAGHERRAGRCRRRRRSRRWDRGRSDRWRRGWPGATGRAGGSGHPYLELAR